MDLRCPQCEKDDQVKAISSVVSGGVSSGAYAGPSVGVARSLGKHGQTTVATSHTTLYGGSQTLTSERLAPPVKPAAKGIPGGTWAVLGILVALIPCCLIGVLMHAGERTSEEGIPILGLVLVVGAIIAIYFAAKNSADERAVKAAAQLPLWETAIARWSKLFHCARCDGVFVPGEEELIPTNQMMQYLYR